MIKSRVVYQNTSSEIDSVYGPTNYLAYNNGAIERVVIFCIFVIMIFPSLTNANGIKFAGTDIPDRSGVAMTVLGPIEPEELGETLMHEHLFIDYSLPSDKENRWKMFGATLTPPTTEKEIEIWEEPFVINNRHKLIHQFMTNRDAYRLDSVDDAINEVRIFQELGGNTIVDVTTIGLHRQPKKLQEVSRKTGAHIIMGTGFYRQAYHPEDMSQRSLNDLTLQMVRDITMGVGNTEVKAGIIGEIPAGDLVFEPQDSDEVRVLRAAAHASQLTGAAITLHVAETPKYLWGTVLDVLEQEGVDLSRVVIGHVENYQNLANFAFFETLLKRGVYLQFDFLGQPFPYTQLYEINTLNSIEMLIREGYSKQILVSHDMYTKFHLTKFGGNGLTFVHSTFITYLREKGIKESDIRNILEKNPMKVLTFVKPKKLDHLTTKAWMP